ncbi:hypothetical protein NDU88_007221 [Pleurodeles waltl]|uniref:Uncharacterized protein n=1 Tax=Pleurodeles waltl TaxID=8319 RepID=A0AAV7RNT9_PLEWA|nr:hypothetical protein NDU88_007221 [Pleurodeles waltl]
MGVPPLLAELVTRGGLARWPSLPLVPQLPAYGLRRLLLPAGGVTERPGVLLLAGTGTKTHLDRILQRLPVIIITCPNEPKFNKERQRRNAEDRSGNNTPVPVLSSELPRL